MAVFLFDLWCGSRCFFPVWMLWVAWVWRFWRTERILQSSDRFPLTPDLWFVSSMFIIICASSFEIFFCFLVKKDSQNMLQAEKWWHEKPRTSELRSLQIWGQEQRHQPRPFVQTGTCRWRWTLLFKFFLIGILETLGFLCWFILAGLLWGIEGLGCGPFTYLHWGSNRCHSYSGTGIFFSQQGSALIPTWSTSDSREESAQKCLCTCGRKVCFRLFSGLCFDLFK